MGRLRLIRSNLLFILLGTASFVVGMSIFTFIQADGHSYFSDNPNSCVNCHVMQDQFEAWGHSSHARVASCNDCHSSHENIVSQYFSKAVNGFNHSLAFTLDNYDEVIMIRDFNVDIVNDSCVGCHADFVHGVVDNDDDSLRCTSCHAGIGHPTRD